MTRPVQPDYFQLRSEWLRFKNHLYDSATELPALAAVLDDVRRLLEERGTLGLVYLDLADAARLEALHGWQWYDDTLRDPDLAEGAFRRQLALHSMEPADVVFEVAERAAVEERQPYRDTLRTLKARGFGIAIDDMGAGYASLQALVDLEPDYLKFDIALVRNIHRSLIKRSLLETLVELSQKIGARVIAEGIEAPTELATLRELGVPLGQGRHLAPPRAVPFEVLALP